MIYTIKVSFFYHVSTNFVFDIGINRSWRACREPHQSSKEHRRAQMNLNEGQTNKQVQTSKNEGQTRTEWVGANEHANERDQRHSRCNTKNKRGDQHKCKQAGRAGSGKHK
jgi:hypothetical protein